VIKHLLTIALLCVLAGTLSAQKQIYKIEWKGDSIGYLEAEKSTQGGLTRFELKSISEFSIVFSFHMFTEYLSVYRDNQLLNAISRSTLNEKERSLTKTKYVDDFYEIEMDGELNRLKREISESIATLYFSPPSSGEIFSERHGTFCKIEKVKDNHYRLIKPDNRMNDYIYSRNGCEEVHVELAMANVRLKRIL
jgi:hypothetical protein